MHPHQHNSLRLKIFHINPYNSEILVLSTLQLHCFHRPGGRGYPAPHYSVPFQDSLLSADPAQLRSSCRSEKRDSSRVPSTLLRTSLTAQAQLRTTRNDKSKKAFASSPAMGRRHMQYSRQDAQARGFTFALPIPHPSGHAASKSVFVWFRPALPEILMYEQRFAPMVSDGKNLFFTAGFPCWTAAARHFRQGSGSTGI
jgi:hypothetical protein